MADGDQTLSATVRLMPLEDLALAWPHIEPLLRRSTQITGCYEPIDVLRLAMAGQVGVWVAERGNHIEAVIVTEIKAYPRRRILEMMFCGGGNMTSWVDTAIDVFDEHAKQQGCSHIACVGRPGWERAWRGRRTGDVVMVRDLKGKTDG